MTVKLRSTGWELGGVPLPWVWGQIQYWDIERAHWHDVLKTYQQAGHRVVSTSVLPGVHQTLGGQYDFGTLRPQNDLAAFLEEAKTVGLKVLLWVGPRSLPGAAAAGYPRDLLEDEVALARDARGQVVVSSLGHGGEVFGLPCLVSERLTRALEPFAEALHGVLSDCIHPDGPVIGLGLTQAPGWATALSAYAADYHPEALAAYTAFLKKRYNKIARLKEVYGQDYSAFSEVKPPVDTEPAGNIPSAWCMDWAAFREDYFIQAAERLHRVFSGLALDRVPFLLASLPGAGRPANPTELEKLRCFAYIMPEAFPVARDAEGLALGAQARFLTAFQANLPKPGTPGDDPTFLLQKQIAQGYRGWEALSPAGSGAWPGFVSGRTGLAVRPHHPVWETIQDASQPEGFFASQIFGDVLLVIEPWFERARYLQTESPDLLLLPEAGLEPESPPVLDPETQAYYDLHDRLAKFLAQQQFPHLSLPGDAAWDKFQRAQVLIVPGSANLTPGFQKTLVQLWENGCVIVVVGELPPAPEGADHPPLSELAAQKPKKPAKGKGRAVKQGRLLHLAEWTDAKLSRQLMQLGVQRPLVLDAGDVRLTFHKFRNRVFVAAVNAGEQDVETFVRREGKFVLRDFLGANKFHGGNNEIKVTLPARQVKFWELIPC